jgi:hypothetical protein
MSAPSTCAGCGVAGTRPATPEDGVCVIGDRIYGELKEPLLFHAQGWGDGVALLCVNCLCGLSRHQRVRLGDRP